MKKGLLSRRNMIKAAAGAAAGSIVPTTSLLPLDPFLSAPLPEENADLDTAQSAATDPIDYVNVLFGTASLDDPALLGNAPPPGEELYTGMVCPGAALPHGIDVSPVNKDISLSYPHGNLYSYTHPRRTMMGFSCMVEDMLVTPLVGDWTTPPDRVRYASLYDKQSEQSTPGHYKVFLPDHRIHVDLTATAQTALMQFTFPQTSRATILLDLGPARDSTMEIVGDRTVRGRADKGRAAFIAEFSKPFAAFGSFHRDPPAPGMVGADWFLLGLDRVTPGGRSESGTYTGCYLTFSTTASEPILIRISAAGDLEQASKTLQAENPDWDFAAVRNRARDKWRAQLAAIEIEGGTAKQRSIFYSCLYHAFASPVMVAKKGDSFLGLDGKTYLAEHDRYDLVPYWDTGRNQLVLLTILEPAVKLDILQSQLAMARESGYMGTSFHGDHAIAMYLGDWERGLPFDYASVYPFLYKNATDPRGPRAKLAEYLKQGWIHDDVPEHPSPPYEGGDCGVSKTLEYCYDDYLLSQYAKKLGRHQDALMFQSRAHNYHHVWDAQTGFMRGRTANGAWIAPFYPEEPYYNFMYKESTAWQTTWFVPHDIAGLIGLMGGRARFVQRLDEFFSTPYRPKAIARDITGLIGQYCHGNEPDHHAPYLYAWAGAPWRTQELVRTILGSMYGSDQAGLGLAGMDDRGENSAWYVMSAMGFYPVDPARSEYILGSPLFDQVTVHLGNGKRFTITAKNNSEKNCYIQAAMLNGEVLPRPWFSHDALARGGELVLTMAATPNKDWGSAPQAAPPSMSA